MQPTTMYFLIHFAFICYLQLSEAFMSYQIQCCTEYRDHIPKKVLKRVETYKIQAANGICDVRAIVLRTKRRTICINPTNKQVLKWIEKKKKSVQCETKSTCRGKNKKNKKRKRKRTKFLKV
ncbi:C-C motif chemokine 28 [Pelobates fuscus]|uniref:C-C motif chemokine 28 n=1 Tax=Pelobates fuscus TaxID=191477 RepID=UPI002FE463F9